MNLIEIVGKSIYHIYHYITQEIPKIRVPVKEPVLSEERKALLIEKLALGYYVVLTRDKRHLSSWFVSLFTLFLTRQWGKYTHAFMNCDYVATPDDVDKFKFLEATSIGVHYSTFDEVFNGCSDICLLTPRGLSNVDWTTIIDTLVKENGKPYDDLFDLADSNKLSCVEVILNSLRSLPDYTEHFKELDFLIKTKGNLVPQMYRQCKDFSVEMEYNDL